VQHMVSVVDKIKSGAITLFIVVITIIVGVAGIIFLQKNPNQVLMNLKDAFKIKKNENGTQVLPKSPTLDKTLNEIESDILGR